MQTAKARQTVSLYRATTVGLTEKARKKFHLPSRCANAVTGRAQSRCSHTSRYTGLKRLLKKSLEAKFCNRARL